MKKIAAALIAGLVSVHSLLAVASINISTFGSSMEAEGWNWNPSTSNLTGTDALGAVLYPAEEPGPFNFTTLDNYGSNPANLVLNLTGFVTTAPVGAFTISLEDANFVVSATPIAWNLFSGTSSTVSVSPTLVPGFLWNNVVGWTLDAGGTGNVVNATFTDLTMTAVPEPSTYALLVLGALALGGYTVRRRRKY
jgi:hypothetical protein